MNDFGCNRNKCLIDAISTNEWLVEDLKKRMDDFASSQGCDFTDYDRKYIGKSLEKVGEALYCLKDAGMLLKRMT